MDHTGLRVAVGAPLLSVPVHVGERGSPVLAGETHLVDLLHLIEQRQAMNQSFTPHLAQCGEVDVAKPSILCPGVIVGARRQAD